MKFAFVLHTFLVFDINVHRTNGRLLADDDDNTAFLPIEIPTNRVFDVQWNPPGHPKLNAYLLDIPWGDRGNDPNSYDNSGQDNRDGHYTFFQSGEEDGQMKFSRKQVDGSYIQVFERVEFLLISDEVLMFNGDPHKGGGFPAGGGFGTLIKGPSIPAGDASGVYDTEPLDESGMLTAKEWLLKNFGNEKLCNNATIVPNGDRSKRASKSSKSSKK